MKNIHEGGHVGSRSGKQDWAQYWPGVILNELRIGGSRDRKRGWNVKIKKKKETIQPRFQSCNPP